MIHREDLDGWTTIIRPDGYIDREEYGHLAAVFDSLEREGRTHILLDLSQVRFLDRGSIIQLLRQNQKAMSRGGALKLLRPTPEAEASLRSAQVIHLFETYRLQSEAIRSFQSGLPKTEVKPVAPPRIPTEEERIHREARIQENRVTKLIAMLENKSIIQPGEMDARCAIEAESIFATLRQHLRCSEKK